MRSLFEIGSDMRHLDELLDEIDGDLSKLGEAEAAFVEWCNDLHQEESHKVDSYAYYLKLLQMNLSAAEAEAEQWQRKARGLASRIEFLKDRLKRYMETKRVTRLEGEKHKVSLVGNGGTAPVVFADGVTPEDVPDRFVAVVRHVALTEVRKALEEGQELGFAKLGERGKHVRVS